MNNSGAAVFDGVANRLELRRFETPKPRSGDAIVRVLGCTLCGSDLHTVEGRRTVATPTVLGHEIVGEVVACGANFTGIDGVPLAIGERVTWAIVASCGTCFLCRRGLPQKCLHGVKYGHEALRPGRELLGGLAEYCLLVPGTAVVRVPADLDLGVACPASCATATIAAALDAAGEVRDRSVLVLGAGMLGLTACAMASAAGASEIICVDRVADRSQRARLFGATNSLSPNELHDVVRESSAGHGVDVVLELTGSNAALETAWPCARLGATIVLVGAVFPGAPLSLTMEQIVCRNVTLRGVHNYAPRHLASAIAFLQAHHRRFPFADLVTQWHPLSAIEAAFALARDPIHLRIGVRPN
jgi:alcohol dehydrogenase